MTRRPQLMFAISVAVMVLGLWSPPAAVAATASSAERGAADVGVVADMPATLAVNATVLRRDDGGDLTRRPPMLVLALLAAAAAVAASPRRAPITTPTRIRSRYLRAGRPGRSPPTFVN